MKFVSASQSKNSSKDANGFAPCFRSAKNSENSDFTTDIVFAVSVFLCLISLICAIGILNIGIIGIIILNIVIIHKDFIKKKQRASVTC